MKRVKMALSAALVALLSQGARSCCCCDVRMGGGSEGRVPHLASGESSRPMAQAPSTIPQQVCGEVARGHRVGREASNLA